MEHPGATFYRQNLILLPHAADTATLMRRANLIAHEMAHMWFGNLVTMRWFDDVWLKEVFANFMADKLVAQMFPAVEPMSAFVLRHWPPALAIDRTEGARPIRQSLDNLDAAAELYDATIYHKAPIAVTELENRIGAAAMRRGLRRYLGDFRFGNADWLELRERLQSETRVDLSDFSRRWIEAPGPPTRDPPSRDPRSHDPEAGTTHSPCYGRHALDAAARERALDTLSRTEDASDRCLSWIALYEDMLDAGIAPPRLLTAALTILDADTDPLLVARALDDLAEIFWRFLTPVQRGFAAGPVERSLCLHLGDRTAAPQATTAPDATAAPKASEVPGAPTASAEGSPGQRRLYWLGAACELATTEPMLARLTAIWRGESTLFKTVPEPLAARIAMTLALQRCDSAGDIMHELVARTEDAARRARLEFLVPALSPERAERDGFFERLIAGRHPGVWSVTGLRLLNAAGRADDSLDYLEPGLQHAAEVRRRGDIFLPRQWLAALFCGHGTPEAAATVRSYLARPGLPERFRQLVLQTADPVFRAARIRG
jgi:aminopeptidase N